jgi:hypothetical protein
VPFLFLEIEFRPLRGGQVAGWIALRLPRHAGKSVRCPDARGVRCPVRLAFRFGGACSEVRLRNRRPRALSRARGGDPAQVGPGS